MRTSATAPTVPAGDTVDAVVVYVEVGGFDTTRRLVAYVDTATGLPLATNGLDVNLNVNAAGLIRLLTI